MESQSLDFVSGIRTGFHVVLDDCLQPILGALQLGFQLGGDHCLLLDQRLILPQPIIGRSKLLFKLPTNLLCALQLVSACCCPLLGAAL